MKKIGFQIPHIFLKIELFCITEFIRTLKNPVFVIILIHNTYFLSNFKVRGRKDIGVNKCVMFLDIKEVSSIKETEKGQVE